MLIRFNSLPKNPVSAALVSALLLVLQSHESRCPKTVVSGQPRMQGHTRTRRSKVGCVYSAQANDYLVCNRAGQFCMSTSGGSSSSGEALITNRCPSGATS